MSANIKTIPLFPKSTDPIFIGTGGFRIGRVDNTIVRDPITNIPKIPGSSLGGTWRYYMAMELQNYFKTDFPDIKKVIDDKRVEKNIKDLVNRKADEILKDDKDSFKKRIESFKKFADRINDNVKDSNKWQTYWGNLISGIRCSGQDELPEVSIELTEHNEKKSGHCGHCIVCKTFGFSKSDKSFQGLAHFSDLNILFFPVATRKGVRWITSKQILEDAGLNNNVEKKEKVLIVNESKENKNTEHLNLGWMNLKVKKEEIEINLDENKHPKLDKIVIVPDNLIAQIINSNLEVRTSVSIDPYTGAAKKGALFTSEAIPRSTYFYGEINIFDRPNIEKQKENNILKTKMIKSALEDSSKYYKSMGIGGMTTRGFGRIDMKFEKGE